jgi:small GTP-binding protein
MQTRRGLGVPQLERLLEPMPERATVLFLADPGVEGEPFLYQAAGAALASGRDVVYAVTNRSPASVRTALDDFGFAGGDASNARLAFVDAFSALMGAASGEAFVVEQPQEPARVVEALERAAEAHPGALLVVDSLSSLADNATAPAFLANARALHAALRRFPLVAALFTRWPYPPEVMDALSGFDATVTLKAVEDRVVLSQYFRLERASWLPAPPDAKPRLYKSVKPGGVFVYVPKIVVTGPFNAGKSSLVHAISDTAVSADHSGTTVAMDHGRATIDGLTADLFGTPGQSRFDPILKVVAGQAVGVILVVDSTQPDSFARARDMLDLTWRQGLPAVVAASKQDLPGALSPPEVERLLAPPPHVRVIGCRGNDRASGREVLRALIEQILEGPEVAA